MPIPRREIKRACRLRARTRAGGHLSVEEEAWLAAYQARRYTTRVSRTPTASIAELVGAVTVVAQCDPSDLRVGIVRQPAWRDACRRLLMLAMRRAGYTIEVIAATVGQPYSAAALSTRRAAADAERGRTIAGQITDVMLQLDRARRGEPVPRPAARSTPERVVAPGETIAVVVRVGSAAWRYLDQLAELAELSEIASVRKAARDHYPCE